MKTCDGRTIDEPCEIEGFQKNLWIQQPTTHVFHWMVTFSYGVQECLCFAGTRRLMRMIIEYKKDEECRSRQT